WGRRTEAALRDGLSLRAPEMAVALGVLQVFFFSSRRRHTRCYRDWSSDVCSSDLERWALTPPFHPCPAQPAWERRAEGFPPACRSEERRVGKECRCRGYA